MKLQNLTHILIGILCIGLFPRAQAVVPPPDGGYPNFTTAEGTNALFSLTTGSANTAVGWFSLFSNAEGDFNTAAGAGALLFNTADENTALGTAALLFNTTGSANTASGAAALLNNIDGLENTAVGASALSTHTTGNTNTAIGAFALSSDTSGLENTAVGDRALLLSTTGGFNTAIGQAAMLNNTTGSSNVAIGVQALGNNDSGSSNIALGNGAGTGVTTATNVICIGNIGGADVDSRTYIGNIYPNVQPIVGTDPDSVTITSAGRLGRGNVSSRRYKHDIKPMDKASEALYALNPVSFRYHKEYDAAQTLAFGLIAEEVAEVAPDLVGRNPEGQPESVRYDQVNAMLLNEFLKEHAKVQRLEAALTAVTEHLKEQDSKIQKVSVQVELSKPAAQTVNNRR